MCRRIQKAYDAATFFGIYVGPLGYRPLAARLPQVQPKHIQPGVMLLVKTRALVSSETGRVRSPIDICRVRGSVRLTHPEDIGEQTVITVEFLVCDR